ncbi:MAG: hypothetical protein QOC70_1480 [Verrucomicrobiota bacterium]|jgi:uncharacterized protein YecT (DUF1311 family)
MQKINIAVLLVCAGIMLSSGAAFPAEGEAAKLEQARQRFGAADADLNKTFQELRGKLRGNALNDLRDRQREWLKHRDYIASDQPRQNGFEGSDFKQSPDYWEAMADLTQDRATFLRAAFNPALPKGITGVYQDSQGGALQLEETTQGIVFSINVVRGPTTHTGGLNGVAALKGSVAVYKEKGAEDRKPCELTFAFSDGHIATVTGKNTEYYHGARAYFDGTYFKVAKLDKPIDLNAVED